MKWNKPLKVLGAIVLLLAIASLWVDRSIQRVEDGVESFTESTWGTFGYLTIEKLESAAGEELTRDVVVHPGPFTITLIGSIVAFVLLCLLARSFERAGP